MNVGNRVGRSRGMHTWVMVSGWLLLAALPRVAGAELSLSVVASPDPVSPDQNVALAITVSNTETTRSNVEASFVIPAAFKRFLIASGSESITCLPNLGGGTYCDPGETLRWSVGTLAPGAGRTLRLSPEIATGLAAGTVAVDVSLLEDGFLPPELEEPVRVEFAVVSAANRRLELHVAESQDPAAPGSLLSYLLTYGHPLASGFTDAVQLQFPVPAGTTFDSASPGCEENGGLVSCTLGRLFAGEGGQKRVTVRVDAESIAGEVLVAGASLFSTTDLGAGEATATSVVRIAAISDLVVAVAAGRNPLRPSANPAVPIDAADVEVTVSNRGPDPFSGVELRLAIPYGVTAFPELVAQPRAQEGATADCVANVAGGGANCDPGEILAWSLGGLEPGQARTVRIPAVAGASASVASGSLLRFDAWASPSGGGRAPEFSEAAAAVRLQGQYLASTECPVVPCFPPRFDIALADDRDPVAPDATLTYTVLFGHTPITGTSNDVVLQLGLPDGVDFSSASHAGRLEGRVVKWTPVTMAPGAWRQRTVTVTVREPASPAGHGDLLDAWAEVRLDKVGVNSRSESAIARAVTRVRSGSSLTNEVLASDLPIVPGQLLPVVHRYRNVAGDALRVGFEGLVPFGVNPFGESSVSGLPGGVTSDCVVNVSGGGSDCNPRERFSWLVPSLPANQVVAATVPYTLVASPTALPDGTVLAFRGLAATALDESPSVAIRAVPESSRGLSGVVASAVLGGVGWRRRRRTAAELRESA